MWKRVQGWSDRPLSRVGRETMLKSVAQAIPTYIMSCFQLPDFICDRMRVIVSDHWWGFEGGGEEIALEILGLVNNSKVHGGGWAFET